MNLTRLACLALLAQRGAAHGHQLKRDLEILKADEWAGVGAGSLNRELRQLAAAGLIEAVRTEQVGRWPERTVYQITAGGQRELAVLRGQAVGQLQEAPDAMAAGLIFSGAQDPAAVAGLLPAHCQAVQAELERLGRERERGMREGYLQPSVSPWQAAAFRRAELRMAAELAWHTECDLMLGARDAPDPPGQQARMR